MELKIRGILVEVDVLETLDGQGWPFCREPSFQTNLERPTA
jgi:hypothetical protein